MYQNSAGILFCHAERSEASFLLLTKKVDSSFRFACMAEQNDRGF